MSQYYNVNSTLSPKLLHIPIRPPRYHTPGEVVFLREWQTYLEENPEAFLYLCRTTGPVRQRAASVAASFMVYMGCNGGASFTFLAKSLHKSNVFGCDEDAYLAAWASHNKRYGAVNYGLRAIEFILASEHPIHNGFLRSVVEWSKVPVITMEDNDIIESMVVWWASEEAEQLRQRAEAEIKIIKENDQMHQALCQ